MSPNDLYPNLHGDVGRGCATPGTINALGKLSWSVALGETGSSQKPAELLIQGGMPVVCSHGQVAVIDKEGKQLVSRRRQAGTPVAVNQQGWLFFKSPNLFLDAVDVRGIQTLKSAAFPGAMSQQVDVQGFWVREKDFVAVLWEDPIDDQRVAAGATDAAPADAGKLTVMRNRFSTRYGDWDKTFHTPSRLPPLMIPGRPVVGLVLDDDIVRIDVDQKLELARLKAPSLDLVEWSVDRDEVYVFLGHNGGRKVAMAVSGQGKTLWRWEDTTEADRWAIHQPPIRALGGRVYVLTEARVLALDAGQLAWSHDLRSEGLHHGAELKEGRLEVKDGRLIAKGAARRATALADGSVLATTGKTLVHLRPDGRKRFALTLDADLLGAPVVDEQGAIYLTTATHLSKIQ